MYLTVDENTSFVCVDLETTGLDTEDGHKICEIGLAKFHGSEIVETMDSIINPQRTIPSEATKIHGITNEMVEGQPIFEEVFPKIKEFVATNTLIFHNADFDMSFLWSESSAFDITWPESTILCTMQIAKGIGGFQNYSLKGLCRSFGIEHSGHRALEDAVATGRLFSQLLTKI